jgi:hypothetical protein
MPSIYTSARPSHVHQESSKKRPSPSADDSNAPTKKRNASLAPSGQFAPVSPKSRHQILEREMQTLFELEYQDEVVEYMHEMDVSFPVSALCYILPTRCSFSPCPLT